MSKVVPTTTELAAANYGFRRFPDFLIAGPHRTGSTWLTQNLRPHPQLFISSIKELHYFCRHTFTHLPDPRRKAEAQDPAWYARQLQPSVLQQLRRASYQLREYGSLQAIRKRGEATACYASLPENELQQLAKVNPSLKTIILVREPIARAWSHAVHNVYFLHQSGFLNATEFQRLMQAGNSSERSAAWLDHIQNDPLVLRGSRYSLTFANWRRCFPESRQLLPVHFARLNQPIALIVQVLQFLEVDVDARYLRTRRLQRRANSYTDIPAMPEDIRRYLADELYEECGWFEEFSSEPTQSRALAGGGG